MAKTHVPEKKQESAEEREAEKDAKGTGDAENEGETVEVAFAVRTTKGKLMMLKDFMRTNGIAYRKA